MFSIKCPSVCLKIGHFDPAFFRGCHSIGVWPLLTKNNFLSFFQVDLLLPILGDPGAICQGERGGGGRQFFFHRTPGSLRMITICKIPKPTVLRYRTIGTCTMLQSIGTYYIII